jgi:hypothetical protein
VPKSAGKNVETGMLDHVALGCFEHYVNLHQHDATFARYMKVNKWLVTFDVLSGAMQSEREYGMLQYLSSLSNAHINLKSMHRAAKSVQVTANAACAGDNESLRWAAAQLRKKVGSKGPTEPLMSSGVVANDRLEALWQGHHGHVGIRHWR